MKQSMHLVPSSRTHFAEEHEGSPPHFPLAITHPDRLSKTSKHCATSFQSEQLSQHITRTFHHTSSACANQLESSSKSPWCYTSSFNLSRLIINFQEPLETRHSSSMVRRKLPARPVTKPTSAAPLQKVENAQKPTVDGRNPAPVDMVNIPLFTGVLYISGGAGFLPSTVLQPFFGEFPHFLAA